MTTATLIVVIALLAVGTYSLRLVGALLAKRVAAGSRDPDGNVRVAGRLTRLLPYAAVALLAALAASAAIIESGEFAGAARPAGVVAGLIAGLLRAPFAAAVVIAAFVAAGLRLLGIP